MSTNKRGKKYRASKDKIEATKLYSIDEAVKIAKESSSTKFDGPIEIHIKLGVNPKHADQIVRGTLILPNGTGKDVKVIAFTNEEGVKVAKEAGAVAAGLEELIEKIQGGWLDFDVAVASSDVMKSLGKVAKTLGQRGLMPNPKAGTVTNNISETIKEIKKGKIEFRTDKEGNLHNVLGKASFDEKSLKENLQTYIKAIREAKPSSAKGTYLQSLTIKSVMGPAVKVDPVSIQS